MTEKEAKIATLKGIIEADEKAINIFYPNGEEGLSENHKRTYNELIENIKKNKKELSKLEK